MSRNLFTHEEIVLCTYAARFDGREIGGIDAIHGICGRSRASIRMKIMNIAAMLDEEGIPRENEEPALSGLPAGETGRRTNWNWVRPLSQLSRAELLKKCQAIMETHG